MNNSDLREEIERYFAGSKPNKAYSLSMMSQEAPAWVLRTADHEFGVAVPYDGERVLERFAGATLKSFSEEDVIGLPGVLALLSSIEDSRNEFSVLCEDFVDPGDGTKRKDLVSDPRRWWTRWKELLGNHVRGKLPQGVLGELLVYYHLLGTGQHVEWAGPVAASHDLQCDSFDAEVKTTCERYGCVVSVTGQFQLRNESDKLCLFFCRLEPHPDGVSIDDMVDRISDQHGVDRSMLNQKLSTLGFEEGMSIRKFPFAVLEIRQYDVDENFPCITPECFKGDVIPNGIQRLSYDVDLEYLPYASVLTDAITQQ